ncbi:MAG: mechanosensitive ion channel [Verrucomicrobia bacterium]|nr:mechanosensitive ion channel [Verrucomicrobiota bacterium]
MDAKTIENTTQLLINLAITYGPKALVGLTFLVAGILVARWVGNAVMKMLQKRELEPPVRLLMVRVVRLLVVLLFMLMAMQNLGIELLPLLAGLGVAGVGIGLALQGVLQNIVAGLTIIFTKPFRVGEYLELLGVQGEVTQIELFSTTLVHADKSRIVIPNRKIVGEILHNYGRIRQLELLVGVAYDTDLNAALTAVRQVVEANVRVLKDFPPVIGVSTLADSSINLSVRPWVKVPDYGPAGAEINQAIVDRFRAANISIPFPQREIRILSGAA